MSSPRSNWQGRRWLAHRAAGSAFALYLGASAISMVGEALRTFTLTLWIYDASSQSGPAISVLMSAQLLPAMLLGAFAGALIDRWPRITLLLSCSALRAVAAGGLILCVLVGEVSVALVLVFISSAVSVFVAIADTTLIPQLVPDDRLERANASWTVAEQSSFVLGPALGALCYAWLGPAPALAVCVACSLLPIPIMLAVPLMRCAGTPKVATREPVLSSMWQGLKHLIENRLIAAAVAATLLRSCSAGINNTMMIFFIASLGYRVESLAWLGVTNGVVQIAIGALLVGLSRRAVLRRSVRSGAWLMMAGGTTIALAPSLPVLILGILVTSIGNAPTNISHNTIEQRFVPSHALGRVRGLQETAIPALFLAGSAGSGGLVGAVGPRSLLLVSAVLLVLAIAVTELWVLPNLSSMERALRAS